MGKLAAHVLASIASRLLLLSSPLKHLVHGMKDTGSSLHMCDELSHSKFSLTKIITNRCKHVYLDKKANQIFFAEI